MKEENYIRELVRRVRIHRVYHGLTQQQLSDRAGLSRSFVSLFEKGAHGIQVVSLRRIATGLDLRFSAVVDLGAQSDVLQLLGSPLDPTN